MSANTSGKASWRDLFVAPGGAGETLAPPPRAQFFNIALALALLIGVMVVSLARLNYNWVWSSVWNYHVLLLKGWFLTVAISLLALVCSLIGGFILALGQRSWFLPARYFCKVLVELVRCTPLLVLILLLWYGIGGVLAISDNYRFLVGVLILTLFESCYIGEIMRSGIESVGRSQIESARAIGLTRSQTYRYVIVPQAVRQILPPLVGQLVSLIKDSSLLSFISIAEFTQTAQQVNSTIYATLETYVPLAIGYLILTVPLSLVSRALEQRFKYET